MVAVRSPLDLAGASDIPLGVPSARRQLGRFVEERLLGRGAMGSVSLARDRETGERVALKRLDRDDGASILRFKNEFRALADSSHPNLVKLYDLTSVDGIWFLAM